MIEVDKRLEQVVGTLSKRLLMHLMSILTRREFSIDVRLEQSGVKAMI
jgi:hypothetical protein